MIKNPISVPEAKINIRSKLSLSELAKDISSKILMGVQFDGRDKYILNEDPAIFFRPFLGLQFVLWYDVDERKYFTFEINKFDCFSAFEAVKIEYIDISGFVKLLFTAAGFEVIDEND